MKVRSIRLKNFKRFNDLIVSQIPETARLIVLAGPNGFGKSSLLESFRLWSGIVGNRGWQGDPDYYERPTPKALKVTWQFANTVQIEFHGAQPEQGSNAARKAFYLRTAYRNDPELSLKSLSRIGSSLDENRFFRMNQTDAAVTLNYQRLVSDAFDDAFELESATTTLGDWRESIIGKLRDAMKRLFPGLTLNGLGSPMRDPTFRFTKGTSEGFVYKNLSGGEKAAFDLLLDLLVKCREHDDTIFCIDEPESHLNPRVQGPFLTELLHLLPPNCQLWVATHSIGMLRRARDIEAQMPDTVVFFDFEGQEFDVPVQMSPSKPTRVFWEQALRVALDDLADLVAPRLLVVCEGTPQGVTPGKNADHDARCYRSIFGEHEPEVAFVSGGNSHDVAGDRMSFATSLPTILKGTEVRRLIDRDDHAPPDVAEHEGNGVRVLRRRNIEAYLYDDEVLILFCQKNEAPERAAELLAAKQEALRRSVEERGNSIDDLKPAAPAIYLAAKRLLGLKGMGNDNRAFERIHLAPLVTPDTALYNELRQDIFGIWTV